MKKQYTKKQIQEAIAHWKNVLEKMDESLHSGNYIPRHQAKRNPSSMRTTYYVLVDAAEDMRGYDGGYVKPDGSLTDGISNREYVYASKTVIPENLKDIVRKALDRYGNDYFIFIQKQPYSYGNVTQKNHARPSTIDIWNPKYKYWTYGPEALGGDLG